MNLRLILLVFCINQLALVAFGGMRFYWCVFSSFSDLEQLPYVSKAQNPWRQVSYDIVQIANDREILPACTKLTTRKAEHYPRTAKAPAFYRLSQIWASIPHEFMTKQSKSSTVRVARDHNLSYGGIHNISCDIVLDGLPDLQKSSVSVPSGASLPTVRFGRKAQIMLPVRLPL